MRSKHDLQMRSLVLLQTDEWSAMVRRHENECYELRRTQIKEEYELLE